MALPKRRKSHAKVRTRRAQWRATAPTLTKCPNCQATALPHRACTNCGQYKGMAVIPPKNKGTLRDE